MVCPKCGTLMEPEFLYCHNCGEEINIVPDFEPEIENSISEILTNVADEFAAEEALDEYEDDDNAEEYSEELLIENKRQKIDKMSMRLIIGIGINIASSPELDNVVYGATSLKDINISISRHDFLKLMINNFDLLMAENIRCGFASIRNKWIQYAAAIGQEIKIMQEQNEKRGIFTDIDDDGRLLLQTDENIEKISAGDIFIIR